MATIVQVVTTTTKTHFPPATAKEIHNKVELEPQQETVIVHLDAHIDNVFESNTIFTVTLKVFPLSRFVHLDLFVNRMKTDPAKFRVYQPYPFSEQELKGIGKHLLCRLFGAVGRMFGEHGGDSVVRLWAYPLDMTSGQKARVVI